MPTIELYGHFAIISSSCEYKKAPTRQGWKYIALLEINPDLKPPSRIDPRLKSIKQIVLQTERFGTWSNPGFFMYRRELDRYRNMAQKFDKLYPLHIVARDWPLALPVYVD